MTEAMRLREGVRQYDTVQGTGTANILSSYKHVFKLRNIPLCRGTSLILCVVGRL